MQDPEDFYMALDHPLARFLPWCPHCATEPKRRKAIIPRPSLYDDEASRVLLNLLLKDGWSLMSPRPYWRVCKKDYKNLRQFANVMGLPIAVSPEGFPIVLRESPDTVDFAAFANYRASLLKARPSPPPPEQPPPCEWFGNTFGASRRCRHVTTAAD